MLVDGKPLEVASPTSVAQAMRAHRRVTTSAPTPRELLAAYRTAASAGASAVVSVHMSGELSGTCAAATLAARHATLPVTVVDSRTVGMALGLAVRAAARVSAGGAAAERVASGASEHAARSSVLFYVDSLDALRRGGRIGHLAAWLGTALMIKPLLEVSDGHIVALEKLRTEARATVRLTQVAAERAAALGPEATVLVEHLDSARAAAVLADRLALVCGRPVEVVEVDPVVAAHAGPGLLVVVVAPAVG